VNIIALIIALLGLGGFYLAYYISHHKKRATLVCPLNGSCDTVVTSSYSKLFGIPVEILGMAYYGLIAISYGTLFFVPNEAPSILPPLAMALTAIAFCFSIYLTAVQALVLKHWCTWCLFSAGICTAIFVLVFVTL
jgi:uncharacterized membrane protein